MLKSRPLPPTFKEQVFPLNDYETRSLVVKGNMAWIHNILPSGSIQNGSRYIYDVNDLLPDVDVALISPTEARIQYMTGKQLTILIDGSSLSFQKYGEDDNDEEE